MPDKNTDGVKNATTHLDDSADQTAEDREEQYNRRKRNRRDPNLKCSLCEGGVKVVTYKDIYQLKKFTSLRGKIISTEKSGVCAKHQRQLTRAIKRARYLALLPYISNEE